MFENIGKAGMDDFTETFNQRAGTTLPRSWLLAVITRAPSSLGYECETSRHGHGNETNEVVKGAPAFIEDSREIVHPSHSNVLKPIALATCGLVLRAM